MLVSALSIAGCITLISEKVSKRAATVLLVIYSLCPIFIFWNITILKDGLAASLCLWLVWALSIVLDNEKTCDKCAVKKISFWGMYVAVAFFFSTVRHNQLYSFIVITAIGIFVIRKNRRFFTVASIFALILILIWDKGVCQMLDKSGINSVDSMSIPLQQMSAVIAYDGTIDGESRQFLSDMYDMDTAAEVYRPDSSDPIKNLVENSHSEDFIKQNRGGFLKCWMNLALTNPSIYMKAYRDLTKLYWIPFQRTAIFKYKMPEGVKEYGVRHSFLYKDAVQGKTEKIRDVTAYLFSHAGSVGLCFWLSCVCMAVLWMKRKMFPLEAFIPISINMFLCISAPVGEFRYAYGMVLCLPYLVALCCQIDVKRQPGCSEI